MYSVKVRATFNAAHNLRGYRGRCERLHGHNWQVEAEVSSVRLNRLGMVCDFKEVKRGLAQVLKGLDHCYLNKLDYFKRHNPTSERIAEFIYLRLKKRIRPAGLMLDRVCVWETMDSCASFTKPGEHD